MNSRFAGTEGRTALVDALRRQKMVSGNTDLAEHIASIGELVEVPDGTVIIEQGMDDAEVYLIVAGSFHIVVNGKTIARRIANDHVGEMAAIMPIQRRAASVIAHEESVAIRLSDSQIADMGDRYPQIWRCFARELAHRVEQRNTAATAVNENVRVLIMAPAAAAEIARAIHDAFENEPFQVVIWTEGLFRGSSYAIDTLESTLDQSDAAIAVVGPDNVGPDTESRDNLLFELGFFMGRLGRHRTFLIEPRNEEIKLPPELAGINTLTYKLVPGEDVQLALANACNKLRTIIHDLGPNR
jgi:CRP/FNR family transcriptional regulator, cyclic AMP receptor protein